jgi:CDP-2,3-bis-(O-geranylgeranyl)-sn-glycerol synthase
MQRTPVAIAKILILIGAANMAPAGLKLIFNERYSAPIDGGLVLRDGRRLLGPSKTWRGLAIGALFPAFLSPLVGLSWLAGMSAGVAAMVGDCISSFAKRRRLGFESSDMALGLDQIPEALLPSPRTPLLTDCANEAMKRDLRAIVEPDRNHR